MLKKAGIIVATAAAGLLAVSSFAFADETVTKDNLTTNCDFTAAGTATSSATGGSSLLGAGLVGAVTDLATNAVAQAPVASCNNVNLEDLLDSGSNNPTTETTETVIKDSNNVED